MITQVISSALWNVGQFGAARMITFVGTVVLARLIAPEAFGLLAMGLLAINVFDRLKDLGVGSALVQSPRRFTDIAPTGVTLSVLSSVMLAVTCLLTAPQLALLLGDPRLTAIVRALAIALLISGLAVLPDALLRRQLRFRDRSVPELAGAVIKTGVSIALAVGGAGVWSLVWGQVAGAAVCTLLYWVACRRVGSLPRLGWSVTEAGRLLRFGVPVSAIALLALVLDNLDYFVIGRRLGADQLGFYTMAFRLPELLVIGVCAVVGQVLFASFSRLQHELPALRSHYLSATATIATVTVPIGLGLSAAAPDIVQAVLGDRFAAASGVLRFLGVYAAIYSLSFHAGEVYKATGRTRLMIILSAARLIVFLPCLWWAAGYSIEVVAGTFLVLQLIFTVVRLLVIRRILRLAVADQWRAIWPALLAGGLAAVTVYGLGLILPAAWGTAPRLLLLGCLGAGLYLLLLSRLDRQAVARWRALRSTGGAPDVESAPAAPSVSGPGAER